MPVYILRHEERNLQNPLFDSPLTERGQQNALQLVNTLHSLNIDTIYTSPFLRIVQTIYPYCNSTQQNVCVEHALYESMDSCLFTQYNSSNTWCDLPPHYHHIVQKQYSSICTNVPLYETFDQVCERVRPFVNYLMQQYEQSTQNVLLATHKTTANAIRHLIDNRVSQDADIAMGGIVKLL